MIMWVGDANEVLFMVTTMRPNETIRIISLRRASEDEEKIFYSKTFSCPSNLFDCKCTGSFPLDGGRLGWGCKF